MLSFCRKEAKCQVKKTKDSPKSGKITRETTLAEALAVKGADKILAKHNFPCLTCPMAQMEMQVLKIGDVCGMYGIDADKLLHDLNSL